jgi:hypothetical protein
MYSPWVISETSKASTLDVSGRSTRVDVSASTWS